MNLPIHKVMYILCINVWTIYILIWLIHSLFLSTSTQHLLCSQCFGRYWECSTEKHRCSSSFHGVYNLSGKQTLNKWLEEVIRLWEQYVRKSRVPGTTKLIWMEFRRRGTGVCCADGKVGRGKYIISMWGFILKTMKSLRQVELWSGRGAWHDRICIWNLVQGEDAWSRAR